MKKLIATLALAIFSVSLATPIIGTKQDITTSTFCKTYGCALWKSKSLGNTGVKEYWYMSVSDTLIQIVRDKSSSIQSARLAFPGFDNALNAFSNKKFISEFNKSFAGFAPTSDISSMINDVDTHTGNLKRIWQTKGNTSILCELQLGKGNTMKQDTYFDVVVYIR